MREPLVHFFLLSLAVFGLFALFDDTPPPATGPSITVTADDARRLAAQFEATWRRPPEPDELDHLIAQFVREEVYVREAMTLGLDRADAIVRQRLRLKMEFLTEAGAQAVDPDDAALSAHLEAHSERFARPPLVAFEQVLLPAGTNGAGVSQIRASLNDGGDPEGLAQPSLLPAEFPPSPPQVVDATFGAGFFDALDGLPVGEWVEPVTSAYGRHLVRIVEQHAGSVPPLSEIRERVLQDWRATLAAELREERFEAMRARYEIAVPSAAEVLGR